MVALLHITYQLLSLCVVVCGVPMNNVSPQLSAAGGNRTTLRSQIAPGLTSTASYRGTLDIVWSCVLTLTACIYTALHLNIPRNTSQQRQLWRKVGWAAVALIAPEIVVYAAFEQFIQARDLVNQLNKKRSAEMLSQRGQNTSDTSKNTSENPKPPSYFDLSYGFYVTMGSFTVDVEKLHNNLSRATLTPSGVLALADRGRFLDISPETVSDKSKASPITKALICIQVVWMVVQCIARKAVDYPLTLLEIHTMVHVVCALTLYSLWWKKPLDIKEPTYYDPSNDAEHLETIAFMIMSSKNVGLGRYLGFGRSTAEVDILEIYEQPRSKPNAEHTTGSGTDSDMMDVCPTVSWLDDHGETHPIKMYGRPLVSSYKFTSVRQTGPNILCTLRPGEFLEFGLGPYSLESKAYGSTEVSMSDKDIRRWKLAYQVTSKDKESMQKYFEKPGPINLPDHFRDGLTQYSSTTHVEPSFFTVFFKTGQKGLLLFAALALLPVAYGGIHLVAWGFEFPSPAESLLWKISCFLIMGFGLLLLYPPLASILIPAARIFLVLESFLSLRYVPIGVYAAVPWVQNIPHI
ncbi:hypothetical protein MMC22_011372 [Lobaria immixta]|nr:hypothetical protein [Lobaria immixta]